MNPERWGEVAETEAKHYLKVERTRERISFGDITGISDGELAKIDRKIAENYFRSERLPKGLRELSADKASIELRKLDVAISPRCFEQALRRLALIQTPEASLKVFRQLIEDGLTSAKDIARTMRVSKDTVLSLANRAMKEGWLKTDGRRYALV